MNSKNSNQRPQIRTIEVIDADEVSSMDVYPGKSLIKNGEMNQIDLPDMMVQNRKVDDIPEKYFKRISHPLPY